MPSARGNCPVEAAVWPSQRQDHLRPAFTPVLPAARTGPERNRRIAQAALAEIPAYHVRQVQDSIASRVEIEHLSGNSFGSIIPNLGYGKVKSLIDLVTSALLLPVPVTPGLIVASWRMNRDAILAVFAPTKRLN